MQLYQKHRPRSFDEIVGQDKAVKILKRLQNATGLAGRAYWITGASGTGKTSIAQLIAADCCDEWAVEELDASGVTANTIANLERSLATYGMGERRGRAVIINEAHGMRRDAIRQLLVTLERIPPHVVWIFTTTVEGQQKFEDVDDASPLLSRCLRLELARQNLAKPFAQLAHRIAEAEGLTDRTVSAFERLAKDCRNNLRAMLSAIETGAMLQ